MLLTQKDVEKVLFGISPFDSEHFDAAERSKGGTLRRRRRRHRHLTASAFIWEWCLPSEGMWEKALLAIVTFMSWKAVF